MRRCITLVPLVLICACSEGGRDVTQQDGDTWPPTVDFGGEAGAVLDAGGDLDAAEGHAIPGTIQAEDFDEGGEGVAYHDTEPENKCDASYRPGEGVDIKTCTDTGGGYAVGWSEAGEWINYTVNVTATGTYDLELRVATAESGKSLHLEMDGADITGVLAVPVTGDWDTLYTSVVKTGVSLTQGTHVLRLVFDTGAVDVNAFSARAGGSDPCAGVTCSGHGSCTDSGGAAQCTCDPGYHAVGTNCVPDTPVGCATPLNNGGCLLPAGPLSTAGNQIVDQNGNPVRLASTHYYTFLDPTTEIPAVKAAGFNSIRMMWYNRSMQGDLATIDQIIAVAAQHGIRVILDNHANEGISEPCWAQQANGLWYDLGGASDGTDGCGVQGTTTDAQFTADWEAVATRYKGDQTVIGYDIRNEPLGYPGMCTWGDGDYDHDIHMMYTRVGNAIHIIDPDKLIIVQGTSNYSAGRQWGMPFAAQFPVVLNVPNKVVYSVHDYPFYIGGFSPDSGPQRVQQLNADWGFLYTQNIGPVWIGEMGANLDGSWGGEDVAGSQAWAQTLLDYMNGTYAAQGGPSISGNMKGVSGCWFAWGWLNFGQVNGMVDSSGNLVNAQKVYWSQMLQ